MRTSVGSLLLAFLALPALAAEEGLARSGMGREAGGPVAKSAWTSPREPEASPSIRVPLGNLKPGGSCGRSEFEVCLDSSGRVSVPGAKRFLPAIPGLKPERLTVKRSGVILGYSF